MKIEDYIKRVNSNLKGDWRFNVSGDLGNGYFANPILNSDYSDPDVIRVNEKYYMVSSTFHLSPGAVLLESEDLINWKVINNAFTNLSEFEPNINWDRLKSYGDGVYACSLRYLKWKVRDDNGDLIKKSKWFIYTTIHSKGIIVSTADDIYGEWETQYMKDRNGNDLLAAGWDDNCPYWEFNDDGTLKSAYMIASKINGNFEAWYSHMFQMSFDGKTLLDADVRCMSAIGDTTRKRTGNTPSYLLFDGVESGEPTGKLINKNDNSIIEEVSDFRENHKAVMINEWGDLAGVVYSQHIPNREGTVINDIISSEGAKIYSFRGTEIGKTTFSGRVGENERIEDYVYIFTGEYWDGYRIPTMLRAKSVYGDKYDDKGKYLCSGSPSDPGVFEVQRFGVNVTMPYPSYEPNQGAFVDIPTYMSDDGAEHWYFVTHHGAPPREYPECRPVSVLPVTWVNGWPMIGEVSGQKSSGKVDYSATIYDGTGLENNTNNSIHHPYQKYIPGTMQWLLPKPPIKGINNKKLRYQDSDNFGSGEYGGQQNSTSYKLSPNWTWSGGCREGFWSLSERLGFLRMYAFSTISKNKKFFEIGNILCQKYIGAYNVQCEIKLDLSHMKVGQEAGLAHFNDGVSYSYISIVYCSDGIKRLSYSGEISKIEISNDNIILKSITDVNRINTFYYSEDGINYHEFGEKYKVCRGKYRGDLIGIFTYNDLENISDKNYVPDCNYEYGYIDVEYFKYLID